MSITSGSYNPSALSFTVIPEPLGDMGNIGVTFRCTVCTVHMNTNCLSLY